MRVTRHHSCRVSPFGHPRIHARLTAPRGITQPPTSFIGSQCQGIHHAPLNTYNTKQLILGRIKNCIIKPNNPTKGPSDRCSQPLSTNQTPHPTTKDGATTRQPPNREIAPPPVSQRSGQRGDGPVVSKPNSVSGNSITAINPVAAQRLSRTQSAPLQQLTPSRLG